MYASFFVPTKTPCFQGDVLSWGIGEIGELGRDVCSMKVPPVPGSDDEPPYDFDGVLRDHLTPGGMYREAADGGGARMENVKVGVFGVFRVVGVRSRVCSAARLDSNAEYVLCLIHCPRSLANGLRGCTGWWSKKCRKPSRFALYW